MPPARYLRSQCWRRASLMLRRRSVAELPRAGFSRLTRAARNEYEAVSAARMVLRIDGNEPLSVDGHRRLAGTFRREKHRRRATARECHALRETPWTGAARPARPGGARAWSLPAPTSERAKRLLEGEISSLGRDRGRDPFRERHLLRDVSARWGVHLADLGELPLREVLRGANKRGPETPVDERDLALDQATHEDVFSLPHGLRKRVDLAATGMRPPAPVDGAAGNRTRERWDGTGCRLENDTMLANEGGRLARCHSVLFRATQRGCFPMAQRARECPRGS